MKWNWTLELPIGEMNQAQSNIILFVLCFVNKYIDLQ